MPSRAPIRSEVGRLLGSIPMPDGWDAKSEIPFMVGTDVHVAKVRNLPYGRPVDGLEKVVQLTVVPTLVIPDALPYRRIPGFESP